MPLNIGGSQLLLNVGRTGRLERVGDWGERESEKEKLKDNE